MTSIVTLDTVLCDWLTVTARDSREVVDRWQLFLNEKTEGRLGTNPKKWQQFKGEEYHFTDGSIFGGMADIKRESWLGFYYSGELAQQAMLYWRDMWERGKVNIKRVDLQATISQPKEWQQITFLNRMHVKGKKAELRQSFDQKSNQQLMTVAIGSRSSDVYMRMYQKITDGDSVLLRMEGEYKGRKADAIMRDLATKTPKAMLKWHMQKLQDKKTESAFANTFEGIAPHKARPQVKVRNKRREWLLNSCLPAFEEFVNSHDDDGQVQSAFVEVLTNAGILGVSDDW